MNSSRDVRRRLKPILVTTVLTAGAAGADPGDFDAPALPAQDAGGAVVGLAALTDDGAFVAAFLPLQILTAAAVERRRTPRPAGLQVGVWRSGDDAPGIALRGSF